MRIILAILGVIVAGAVFFEFTEPTYAQIQSDQAQIAQYDAALTKASQLASVKQALLAKYNSFAPSDLARLQTMVPDQVNDIALILDFDTLAGKQGMSLANVDVNSSDASAVQSTNSTGVVGAVSVPYNTLTMKFTVNGTYANFTQFLASLQASLAIVDIQSILISENTQANSSAGASVYTFTVTLNTYWLKPANTSQTTSAATSTS